MRTPANSRKEFFEAVGERAPALRKLDKLIREAAPDLKPVFVNTPTMTGLGYGSYPVKYADGHVQEWPVVGLGPQKHYMSLYVCIVKDGEYLAEIYQKKLGKVSCGRSCIRFKRLEDLDLSVVKELLKEANKLARTGRNFAT